MNDNFFVNPFSSDVISPTLHYVLNLNEEAKLTNRSTNELKYLQVPVFFHLLLTLFIPDIVHYNAGHNHVKTRNKRCEQ